MANQGRLSSTVLKAFRILDLLAGADGSSFRLKEVSDELEVSKSTAYRYLATLEEVGAVEQDDAGRFSLGPRLAELGGAYLHAHGLRRIAEPFLQDLAAATQETEHLAVPSITEAVYIAKVDSIHSVQMASRIGSRAAMHCTALGKAILAYSLDLLEEIVAQGVTSRTRYTIVSPEALRLQLARVRAKGYAIDDEENELGVRCVGAPVFDHSGKVIGAVSVSGPINRVTKEKAVEWGSLVRATAAKISKGMGYPGRK